MRTGKLFWCALLVVATVFCSFAADKESDESKRAQVGRKIAELIRRSGAETVGVAFYDLQRGEELTVNPEVDFHAASTMKVPVMMEVFRQAQGRAGGLDEKVVLRNEFRSIVDGSPYRLTATEDSEQTLYARIGQRATTRELIRLMITESSNFATNVLIERVTPERVAEHVRSVGAKRMRVLRGVEDGKAFAKNLNNTTTARDLMIVLRRIAEKRAVSAAASEEMIDILAAQKFNEGIPAGLPAGVRVAHKTGSITKIRHDAGIVYPTDRGRPYVLVVLTRGLADENKADELIASISRAIYESLR